MQLLHLLLISLILLGKKQTFNSIVGSLLFPLFVTLTRGIDSYIKLNYGILVENLNIGQYFFLLAQ